MQNKSGTAGASTNWALSNDLGTDSTYYGEMGMNSSVFSASTPADYFSINNGIYFSGHDGDVSIGSGNGFKTYLAWGSTGQSAHVINATGALGFSTNLGTTPALSGTTGFGSSGHVLVSAGSAAAPAWSGSLTGLTTVTTANDASISGLTVGKGNSSVATNTVVGASALISNTTASNGVALGYQAGNKTTTGAANIFIGSTAGNNNTTGESNVYIGYQSAFFSTTNSSNVQVGSFTASSPSYTGSNNSLVGWATGGALTSGNNNSMFGRTTGNAVTTGTQNTILGSGAGSSGTNNLTTGSNNIIIGYNAAASSATVSNEVTIGNSSSTVLRLPFTVLVANLPAAATVGAGARSFVTNALAPSFGAAVVGGGAVSVPVYSDGTTWNVG
jgi:hypothetical protein